MSRSPKGLQAQAGMAPARSRSPERPKTSSVGNVFGLSSERNCVCLVHWPDNAVTERTNGNRNITFARISKYLQGYQSTCNNIKIFGRTSKCLQEYKKTCENIKTFARNSKRKKVFKGRPPVKKSFRSGIPAAL